ncbi:MAG: hypothetical protein M3Q65_15170 [Chloroflexota bacterium]|nr:hypothetical protein [Chloroflexota bacterium]
MLRRAVAWADRLLHAGASAGPPASPAPRPTPASTTDTEEATRAAPPHPAMPDASPPTTADGTDLPPVPLDPQHREGLRQAAAHRWNRAQREVARVYHAVSAAVVYKARRNGDNSVTAGARGG